MMAQVLGFPTALGMPRWVGQSGPDVLRRLGLMHALWSIVDAFDLGNIAVERADRSDDVERRLRKVMSAARRQARSFPLLDRKGLPITLGGDHSTSLGTALALAQQGQEFDVVWIDAHGDFNTPRTSPSGNPHGMVLAILAGLTRLLPEVVSPARLHLWGVRDLDPAERELLDIHCVEPSDRGGVRSLWPG